MQDFKHDMEGVAYLFLKYWHMNIMVNDQCVPEAVLSDWV